MRKTSEHSNVRKCNVAIFDQDGYTLVGDATYTAVKPTKNADHAIVTVTFVQKIPKTTNPTNV